MSDLQHWSRVKEIVDAALDVAAPLRPTYLRETCGDDHALQAEVESLLVAYDRAGSFGEQSPLGALDESAVASLGHALRAGDRLGPYEIRSSLGAGGMGEVYRATDTRLGRDVAVKVLPTAWAADAERRKRFEREARAVAALNHPNICTIHDVGYEQGSAFLVMELIAGESLAARLERRPMSLEEALARAIEIADALDKAHRQGIIHRDLKPGNVMLLTSSAGMSTQAKLLDFGLARIVPSMASSGAGSTGPMGVTPVTDDGVVLGTVQYMAPEQIEGRPVDARTDIFAFGSLLYEMVTGRRAFEGTSTPAVMAAILRADTPSLESVRPPVPTALDRLVRTCLAKDPDDRLANMHDIALQLRWIAAGGADERSAGTTNSRGRRQWLWAGAAVLAAASLAGAYVAGRYVSTPSPSSSPRWQRLTYQRGFVDAARFAPDGQTILYSAAWDGRPFEVFSTTATSPESRPLDLPPAGLLAISKSGELALSLGCTFVPVNGTCSGTLARVPMLGGAPRALMEGVRTADFGADSALATGRLAGSFLRIEYPSGTVLTERGSGYVRISPDGRRIAWTETAGHTFETSIMVRDDRGTRPLSSGWSVAGLAWAPDGEALYVSGMNDDSRDSRDDAITLLSLDGQMRQVVRGAARMRLLDAAPDGRLLVSRTDTRGSMTGLSADERWTPRDLTWLGDSIPDAMSPDGRTVLFTVRAGAFMWTRSFYPIYVRSADGGPATRLGTGYGVALSPDGQWALTRTRPDRGLADLMLVPLGPGPTRTLERAEIDIGGENSIAEFAGSSKIVLRARRPDEPWRTHVIELAGGAPTPLEHEPGVIVSPVSPDGRLFVSLRDDGSHWLASVAPAPSRPLPTPLAAGQRIVQWTEDGRALYVSKVEGAQTIISTLDLATGQQRVLRETPPTSEIGLLPSFRRVFISRDGRRIVRGESNTLGALYLVDGVR